MIINNLQLDDLSELGWAATPSPGWPGSPMHLKYVADEIRRASAGELEYLAVRIGGRIVCIGGIAYPTSQSGFIYQLIVHPSFRRQGLGSMFMSEAERRIMDRGRNIACLWVEDENVDARRLYEQLGYEPCGHKLESWTIERDGVEERYEANGTVMRKILPFDPKVGQLD